MAFPPKALAADPDASLEGPGGDLSSGDGVLSRPGVSPAVALGGGPTPSKKAFAGKKGFVPGKKGGFSKGAAKPFQKGGGRSFAGGGR